MRRILLTGSCGLALLMLNLGIWLVHNQSTPDQTPPGVTMCAFPGTASPSCMSTTAAQPYGH